MSFYIDLTEFLTNPIKTGIQRVAGELCKYLPADAAIPVRLHAGRYVSLSSDLIRIIGGYFNETSASGIANIQRVGAVANGIAISVSQGDTVLVPEVFYDPERVAYFRQMTEQELKCYRFIVYDLLPITHPEYFACDMPLDIIYGYFQVIRRAFHCGFISEYTRDVYYGRLKRSRTRDGVVLPLGSDSLGPRGLNLALNRSLNFSVVGTIEPRKNHALILDAFEPLLRQIDGPSLTFIGKVGWTDSDFINKVKALAADETTRFHFLSAPNDGALRSIVEQSLTTIYVSLGEGYGLPPVESLWLGTPVIACAGIPSLHGLGQRGIHYVEPLSVVNLQRAALAFMDEAYANKKTQETISLNLPTWQSFTQKVLDWCN